MKEQNNQYDLTKEEYNSCLSQAEIFILMKGQPVKNPRSIFVVAQPGAGKSYLKTYVVSEAQNIQGLGEYVQFNPDDIAVYHKYYKEILEKYPENSYSILQKFIQPALDTYLRARAVQLKNNIVQEGTFRKRGWVCKNNRVSKKWRNSTNWQNN